MRFILRLLAAIAIALSVGFGLSYYALTDGRLFGALFLGPWTAWPDVGSPAPNPYTRGHLAREAALQLGRSEGLQFVAETDSDDALLDLGCSYLLAGHVPISTFWTLSAVDANWVNLAAPGTDPTLRSSEIVRENDGVFHVHIGKRLRPGNWLELAGEGEFQLVLTLYDTTALSSFTSSGVNMPSITLEQCS